MGRKDIPEHPRGGHSAESGIYESFCLSEGSRVPDLQKICCFLEPLCEKPHTIFIHGREKRRSRN